ncbi:hypothetical protein RZS08_08175, partial [Arthrospira platensis SPKY1]|nr:hypothetical protein [Arthrospira platensis SPKY1]
VRRQFGRFRLAVREHHQPVVAADPVHHDVTALGLGQGQVGGRKNQHVRASWQDRMGIGSVVSAGRQGSGASRACMGSDPFAPDHAHVQIVADDQRALLDHRAFQPQPSPDLEEAAARAMMFLRQPDFRAVQYTCGIFQLDERPALAGRDQLLGQRQVQTGHTGRQCTQVGGVQVQGAALRQHRHMGLQGRNAAGRHTEPGQLGQFARQQRGGRRHRIVGRLAVGLPQGFHGRLQLSLGQ